MSYDDYTRHEGQHYYDGEPRSFNNIWLGLALFLAMPFLTLFCIIWISGAVANPTAESVWNVMNTSRAAILMPFFVAAYMPNLIGFFVVYKQERWKMAYGAAISSLLFFVWFLMR